MKEEVRDADPAEIDLSPLRQLVKFWRDRAERMRGQSPESPRAEVFDTCAAQLAEALAALRALASQEGDPGELSLFRSERE